MSDCSKGLLNEQAILQLQEQGKFLVSAVTDIKTSINSIELCQLEMKKDNEWLKSTVENHIKNSVGHIKQIGDTKDLSEVNESKIKFCFALIWFLFISVVGGAIFIIRDALT